MTTLRGEKRDKATKKKYRVIGTRPVRHDGVDKVTGRAKYGADLQLSGMLFGAVLRSPHAHARIVSIDVAPALAVPGVRAVMTHDDLPDPAHRTAELGEGAVDIAPLEPQRHGSRKGTVQRARRRRCGRRRHPHSGRGGPLDSCRVRGAAAGPLGSRRDEGRRADPARKSAHAGDRRRQARRSHEHRPPLPLRKGERGGGLRPSGTRRRTQFRHGDRAPGLYRAAQRDGPLERRRAHHRLDEHARGLRRAGPARRAARRADLADQSRADGDRRRLRRQDRRVSRAAGGHPLAKNRAGR